MVNLEHAKEIVAQFENVEGGLLECLHSIQKVFGYVPRETIDIIADGFNISRAEVHGVISYYHDFRTEPAGRAIVRVCQAEACQAMGSRSLTKRVEEILGLELGDSNENFTLDAVYCFGNCALSPNLEIDGKLHARVDKDNFEKLLKSGGET